ncbi:MAG: hypothetical protein LCH37_06585 [Bacteroidetes bacterium]|nr:hypothetical protein [Bacteroidota bacterium]MCK6611411.1 hypothetical protein [Bacteroidia bacterium]
MKKAWFILIVLAFPFLANSQDIGKEDGLGKTYYDEAKTRIKEIFHYVLEYRFGRSEENPDEMVHKSVAIKNGPYTLYFTNGKLQASGYYSRDKKTGTWKYYNREGLLIRTEEYKDGELIKKEES